MKWIKTEDSFPKLGTNIITCLIDGAEGNIYNIVMDYSGGLCLFDWWSYLVTPPNSQTKERKNDTQQTHDAIAFVKRVANHNLAALDCGTGCLEEIVAEAGKIAEQHHV